jgi:hypothetical protein
LSSLVLLSIFFLALPSIVLAMPLQSFVLPFHPSFLSLACLRKRTWP